MGMVFEGQPLVQGHSADVLDVGPTCGLDAEGEGDGSSLLPVSLIYH